MADRLTLKCLTEQEVSSIFAHPESEAARRWIDYWASTESRNAQLLGQFQQVVSLGFRGRTVLDIGCGSAGLAAQVVAGGGCYIGADYSPYVLRMGRHWLGQKGLRAELLRTSGSELPFRDESFDYVFAFDVIEHLERGGSQQLQFLRELRRVLRPMGMIFLTTPNKGYPFEGHTFLYFPQYLPATLADQYIRWKNPGFLEEHGSFGAIKLLSPAGLKRLLSLSELIFLHQLPCCMDIEDWAPGKRLVYRLLGAAGLAWHPMQEFWGCLVRREHREALRVKCAKHHAIALRESGNPALEFTPGIDFSRGPEAHQLKCGWFPRESAPSGFRWTGPEAELWLQADGAEDFFSVSGYCGARPQDGTTTLRIYCDDRWIGQRHLGQNEPFDLAFLLPYRLYRSQICTFRLAVDPCHTPGGADQRKLGIAVNRAILVPAAASNSAVDFDRGPESQSLGKGWFTHERDQRGLRWTSDEAELDLCANGGERFLSVIGYCNALKRFAPVTVSIFCDKEKIGEHHISGDELFCLSLPLAHPVNRSQICSIRIITEPAYIPGGADRRKLGVIFFRIALE
ncbi:MAG: class I SAM-dependent methyltransferase [Acidobacteria bacterium]|nr:class I SAM-dependent methyltransferase [Acidobacteriota bacterium]